MHAHTPNHPWSSPPPGATGVITKLTSSDAAGGADSARMKPVFCVAGAGAAAGAAADFFEAAPWSGLQGPLPVMRSTAPTTQRKMMTHTTTAHTAAELPPFFSPPVPGVPVGEAEMVGKW